MICISFPLIILNFWQFQLGLFELILNQCDEILPPVVVLDEIDPWRQANIALFPGREGRLRVELGNIHSNPRRIGVVLQALAARLSLESFGLLLFGPPNHLAVDSNKLLYLHAHVRLLVVTTELRVVPTFHTVSFERTG